MLQTPQLMSFALPLCRMARTLSRLLWWKLVGNLSKRFASAGRSTSAWHSGQRNFPFFLLISAWFFKHSQQNVWRQVIVLGSVKVCRQIEQVTCSLRSFSRDSIVEASFTATETHPILGQWDVGKLGPYTVVLELQNMCTLHCKQPTRFESFYPLTHTCPILINTLYQTPVDKTWSPMESGRKMNPLVQQVHLSYRSLVIRRNLKCEQYFERRFGKSSDPLETHRFRWNLRRSSRAMSQNKHTARVPFLKSYKVETGESKQARYTYMQTRS